jgi:hypothetical protein
MANHTAIIAQSGSGKSFFLGRLIEEIVLKTRARCIIFDPNADFRKFDEVEKDGLWKKAKYDLLTRRGKLPHEGSQSEFKEKWSLISKLMKSRSMDSRGSESNTKREQLKLRWTSVSVDFFADDADSALRSELYHCNAFVKALEPILALEPTSSGKQSDLIDEAESLLRKTFDSNADFQALLLARFSPEEITKPATKTATKTVAEPTKTALKTASASGTAAGLKAFAGLEKFFQAMEWLQGFASGLLGDRDIRKLLIEQSIDRLVKAAGYVKRKGQGFILEE